MIRHIPKCRGMAGSGTFLGKTSLLSSTLYDDIDVSGDGTAASVSASPWAVHRARILAPSIVRHKELLSLQTRTSKDGSSLKKPLAAYRNGLTSAPGGTLMGISGETGAAAAALLGDEGILAKDKEKEVNSSETVTDNNSATVSGTGSGGSVGGGISSGGGGFSGGLLGFGGGAAAALGLSGSGLCLGSGKRQKELYNPTKPNDYEQIVRERTKQKQLEELQRQKTEELERLKRERERERERYGAGSSGLRNSNELHVSGEEAWRRRAELGFGSNTTSVISGGGGEGENETKKTFAARMMEKMGWKQGEGLGREKQGIVAPLVAKKTDKRSGVIVQGGKIVKDKPGIDSTIPPSVGLTIPSGTSAINSVADGSSGGLCGSISALGLTATGGTIGGHAIGVTLNGMQEDSRIVLLTNMVGRGEVDEELKEETEEEAGKFGNLLGIHIVEVPDVADEDSVRLFLEYETIAEARKALLAMNGRKFGGRIVRASFYDLHAYKRRNFFS